jgi:RNA ligase
MSNRSEIFPIIKSIDDVLPAISEAKEFFLAKRDGYIAIDYHYRSEDTFGKLPGASEEEAKLFRLRRECRGIKFDAKTGEIICRPYHKFFNLGELGEFQPHEIDWRDTHHVLEKLDGSMIAPARVAGKISYMTRISDRDVAAQAAEFANSHPSIAYERFVSRMLDDGLTPIFEWCSRQQRIVIDYPEDRLVLTGLRRMNGGGYVPFHEMAGLAARMGIPVVSDIGGALENTSAFLAMTNGLTESEGYIVRFGDGQMIKLKAEAYVMRHSALSDLASEKRIMKIVLGNLDDDFGQLLDAARRTKLETYAEELRTAVSALAEDIEERTSAGWNLIQRDRKRFALEIRPELPPALQGVAFAILDGKPSQQLIVNLLDRHTGSAGDIDRIRPLIGGLRWDPDLTALDE